MSGPTGEPERVRPVERVVEAWGADIRAADAAGRRARTRNLLRQAAEDSDLWSVLADAAEATASVAISLVSGGRVVGVVEALGSDFAALAAASGRVLVRISAVAAIQAVPADRVPWPSAARSADGEARRTTLGGVLGEMADGERSVRLEMAGGGSIAGELELVARDFALIRKADGDTYVSVGAIAAVWL